MPSRQTANAASPLCRRQGSIGIALVPSLRSQTPLLRLLPSPPRYVRSPHRHNATLAQTGVNVFLNMMLKDNFIHADLHPGASVSGAGLGAWSWAGAAGVGVAE